MNILLLGPIHRYKDFLQQHGQYPFVKGQGQQSWVEALEGLGHKVTVFRYTDTIFDFSVKKTFDGIFAKYFPKWKTRFNRVQSEFYYLSLENVLKNKKLLSIAEKSKPNILLISGGVSCLFPKTIQTIKKTYKCKVVLLSGINPMFAVPLAEKQMVKNKIIDVVVENDRGYASLWKKIGAKKTIVLPISSVDPKLHKIVKLSQKEQKKYGCDVCFVGTLSNKRQELLKTLTNFNLKIWGDLLPEEPLMPELLPYYHGMAHGEEMVKILNASTIVLNFQPQDMTHGGNMRTFEIPGCKAFQLADKVDDDWFKDGRDIVLFKNKKELIQKIKYYLTHPLEREQLRKEAYQKVYSYHTYEKHFKKLLSEI